MDELSRYVFDYYDHLMTREEAAAYKTIIARIKEQQASSPAMKRRIRDLWISEEAEVQKLLLEGEGAFYAAVKDRILRENADAVFLNYCPRCSALARTPQAKQCPKCFHSWRAAENSGE